MLSKSKVAPVSEKAQASVDVTGRKIAAADTKKDLNFNSMTLLETSVVPASSNDVTTSVNYRADGLSTFATLVNFIKGMIGPGCLSLPLALKQAGLWTALVLIFVFGFLNNYCMLQLVRSSQKLSRNKGQILDYGGVAYEACAQSFKPVRKYRNLFKLLVTNVIIFLQVGICSVFYVFISTHVQEIVENETTFRASLTTWNLIIFLPLALINLISSLKIIAVFLLTFRLKLFLFCSDERSDKTVLKKMPILCESTLTNLNNGLDLQQLATEFIGLLTKTGDPNKKPPENC